MINLGLRKPARASDQDTLCYVYCLPASACLAVSLLAITEQDTEVNRDPFWYASHILDRQQFVLLDRV